MKLPGLAMLLFVMVSTGPQTQKRDPCEGETTPEMKLCAAKRFKQADDELNSVYRRLMSKLDDEGHKTALRTAQQAWLKYRDSNCDFESYLNRGGTIYSVVVTHCMASMTSSRTKELKEEIADLER
jgi:uncharacterized protein YecT (DUF1311 family)